MSDKCSACDIAAKLDEILRVLHSPKVCGACLFFHAEALACYHSGGLRKPWPMSTCSFWRYERFYGDPLAAGRARLKGKR